MRIVNLFAIAAMAAVTTGCGQGAAPKRDGEMFASSDICRESGIVVSDAWVRSARAGQPTSAAYLKIVNCSETDDALIAASYDGASAAELHVSAMTEDAMASMAPTHTLALPAGEPVELTPGGAHIMLIGIDGAIQEGDDPLITLQFEKAEPLSLVFEVHNVMREDARH